MSAPGAHNSVGGDFVYPNGNNQYGIWGSDNFLFGSVLFDWRRSRDSLPQEVMSYLEEHENDIYSEDDVDRLVREYEMKK